MKKAVAIIISLVFQVSLFAQETADINALLNSSIQYEREGDYQKALEGFLTVGRYFEKHKNNSEQDRQLYVDCQKEIASCYSSLYQCTNAFMVCELLLEEKLTEEDRGAITGLYIGNGCRIVDSCMNASEYSMAISVCEKIIPLANDTTQPVLLRGEGLLLGGMQKFHESLGCLERAYDSFHKFGMIEYELQTLLEIGSVKSKLNDSIGALEAYQRADNLLAFQRDDKELMRFYIGQLEQARMLGNYGMERDMKLKIDSLGYATNNLDAKFLFNDYKGDEAKGLGDFVSSEHWYKKNEQYLSNEIKSYYYCKLRDLYSEWGKLDEALEFALLCIGENQSVNESNYLDYIFIANLYKEKGDCISCIRLMDTLIASMEGFDESLVGRVYGSRADCYLVFGEYEKALADYRKADELLASKYDEYYDERLMMHAQMGGMEFFLGHCEEAERLYGVYADGIRKLRGDDHVDYIYALKFLADAESCANNYEATCENYMLALDKLKQHIRERLPFFNTEERESYWDNVSKIINNMTAVALEAEKYKVPFTKSCYNGLVLLKAFLLNSEQSVRDLVMTKGTADDQQEFMEISSMQKQIEQWQKDERKYVDSILWLTDRMNQMETRLATQCQALGDLTAFMDVVYEDIKGGIEDGDVLIDFTDFVSDGCGRVYAAYVVNNKQEYPLLMPLFEESKIDSVKVSPLLREVYGDSMMDSIQFSPHLYYKEPYAQKMYRLLWSPFEDLVAEGSTIYYVPSQLLFQIALESLPAPDGKLLGEHYRFVRLSSARELIAYKENLRLDLATEKPNVVLYGGLKYDMNEEEMSKEAGEYQIPLELLAYNDKPRGGVEFEEVPGTKLEIDMIEKIMESHNVKVKPFYGTKGTEESFLSLNGKAPKILHLATHGFYYTPDKAMGIKYLSGYEDAMHLSGLVLAGGNTAWKGNKLPEGVCDGILTAADIARLDLSGVELVVLSACKTGRGQATPEGLYGLQRAFKKAGVKTIVMSLWNVEDAVAPEFMKVFYENLMNPDFKGNKRQAFDATKSYVRTNTKYKQPYYWAGFVMLD